jgi:methylglutamate dehydrogenase subunit D
MLERRSALATTTPCSSSNVTIVEASGFSLTQYAGSERDLKKAFGITPPRIGLASTNASGTLFRTGPQQLWLVGPPLSADNCFVTTMTSSRCRMEVSGVSARDVLSRCAQIDFHPKAFKPGKFSMTGIHHTPVLVHCAGSDTFHVYALRTFAQDIWEWLTDAAKVAP